MSPEFHALLSQHIGFGLAKQMALADFLGDRNWGVDINEGQATFGDDLAFPIQLPGTEAEGDSTWLWAWANEASDLPPALLEASEQMRQLGAESNIPELAERSFSLDIADGHLISMIASGLNPECCYYRGQNDGGALFFLVQDLPADVVGAVSGARAATVLTEVVSSFDVDHRIMAQSFLESQGFELQIDENNVTATRGRESLRVSFNSHDLIENIEATLNGS
jgi:hypothetical protein